MRVRYSGNKFDQKELYAAVKTVTDDWWVFGQKCYQFQSKFADYVGKRYGIFVNSGSSANFLALYYAKSLGYKKVITPVAGFPTTINPIIQLEMQPLFIDIELKTLNLNVKQLQEVASQNPGSVLMFAHALGNPPSMKRIMEIVQKYNLYFIQDCCDALGSFYYMEQQEHILMRKNLGTFGDLSTFSFYPAHHMSTGQGGMILTDDQEVYKRLTSMRDWGRDCFCHGSKDANKTNGRCGNRFSNWLPGLPDLEWDHKYSYGQIGFNLKPLELQGAIGLQQLKKLQSFDNIRLRNFYKLDEVFQGWKEYFHLSKTYKHAHPIWFAYPITLKQVALFSRQDIISHLQKHNIETRLYFGGNILYHKAYQNYVKQKYDGNYELIHERFPVAKYVTQNTFFLGVSQVITPLQINYMTNVLLEFLNEYN